METTSTRVVAHAHTSRLLRHDRFTYCLKTCAMNSVHLLASDVIYAARKYVSEVAQFAEKGNPISYSTGTETDGDVG